MISLHRFGKAVAGQPPVLAIPGIDGSPGSLRPVVERLAERRQVLVADYSREQNATLEALSEEIAQVARAEAQGEGPFDLVGQSIGTIVAAQLDGRMLLPVRRVALCCTFTRLRWNVLRVSNFSLGLTPGWLFRATSPAVMALVCGPVGDGKEHPFFAAAKESDKAGVIKRTGWEIGRDFSADLARVRAPLLVMMGAADRFVPHAGREVEKLRALYTGRDARIEVIPGAGHVLLPSAAVTRAAARIESFFAGQDAEAAA